MNERLFVFDIDETLVHTFDSKAGFQQVEKDPPYEIYSLLLDGDFYWGFIRPQARELLKLCNKYGKVAFWSAGEKDYVDEIIKILLKDTGIKPFFVWSRKYCMNMPEYKFDKEKINEGDIKKPLEKILYSLNLEVDMDNVVIFDDRKDVSSENVCKLIWVYGFKPNKKKTNNEYDNELLDIINYLTEELNLVVSRKSNKTLEQIASEYVSKSRKNKYE